MRRIIIIAGLVLCAVLMEGIAFFLSSHVPDESEVAVEVALSPPSVAAMVRQHGKKAVQ